MKKDDDLLKELEFFGLKESNKKHFHLNPKRMSKKEVIEVLKKIREKLKHVTKRQIAVTTISAALVFSAVKTGESIIDAIQRAKKLSKDKNKYLCLMKVNQNKLELYDEDENVIENQIEITDEMYVVTTTDKSYDFYGSYLVNMNGEMQYCYLKKNSINFKKIYDQVDYVDEIKAQSEIDVVAPDDGCWIRKEKIVDKNTNAAMLLNSGTNVIASTIDSTSNDNDYYWKNVIYVDVNKKSLFQGYMIDGYLMNKNYGDACGLKFEVVTELNIRKKPSIEGDVIGKLNMGQKVILVPNIETVTSDNVDWFYIAYEEDSKIKFGYCAATQYVQDQEPHEYLKIFDDSYLYDEKYSKKRIDFSLYNTEKMIDKVVRSNIGIVKLRRNPGLNSDIIYYLDNDTYVYTYDSNMNSMVEMDGYNWVKVYLANGTEGYVASEFLNDYVYDVNERKPLSYEFKNTSLNGYFGVDVDCTTNPTMFEKLISEKNKYDDDYPKLSQKRKIDFAIIKIGATANGSGPFQIINKSEAQMRNLSTLLNICEKTDTPYGIYYYSQATTIDEANEEIIAIKRLINVLGLNTKNSKNFPLYIDIEDKGFYNGCSYNSRVQNNAIKNGKGEQTKVVNYLMSELRNQIDMEVCLYTDSNTMESSLNFSELDDENKSNCWIVESTIDHTNKISDEVYQYIKTRQIAVDRKIYVDSIDKSINVDFDVMDCDFYKDRVK